MSNKFKNMKDGWALASMLILSFIVFSIPISSCSEKDQSKLLIVATASTDTIAPGGHVLYDVHSWTTTGGKIVKVSLIEMSDEQGLRVVETREEDKADVTERFDYASTPTTKDTSEFKIIFNAEDDLGNTQEYQRNLHVIRPKSSTSDSQTE